MKIKYSSYRGKVGFYNIKQAVKHSLEPGNIAYSYDGQLEKLYVHIEKLQECLATLISHVELNSVQLQDILGDSYEVEE